MVLRTKQKFKSNSMALEVLREWSRAKWQERTTSSVEYFENDFLRLYERLLAACGCRKVGIFCNNVCLCEGGCFNSESIEDEDESVCDFLTIKS